MAGNREASGFVNSAFIQTAQTGLGPETGPGSGRMAWLEIMLNIHTATYMGT